MAHLTNGPTFRYGILLALEFLALCVALPTCIITYRLAPYMFAFLWGAGAYCAFWIIYKTGGKFVTEHWKWNAVTWNNMNIILLRFALCCIGMLLFLYAVDPDRLFEFVLHRPYFVFFLMFAYPVLSAFPQELIFTSFFFHRYAHFFKTDRQKIIASALVFAYAHVLFINWVAPFLSLIAGFIFASTYARTRSLALVTIEHALYGNALFVIGLGWYFYHGAVH